MKPRIIVSCGRLQYDYAIADGARQPNKQDSELQECGTRKRGACVWRRRWAETVSRAVNGQAVRVKGGQRPGQEQLAFPTAHSASSPSQPRAGGCGAVVSICMHIASSWLRDTISADAVTAISASHAPFNLRVCGVMRVVSV